MNATFETMESRTLMSGTISSTQKANLTKLATDLKAIHTNSNVTVGQLHQLGTDIATAVKSAASKPSSASVSAFKAEVKAVFSSGSPLTTVERKTLAIDFDAILTSSGVSPTDVQVVGTDIKGIISASHVTSAEGQEILSDLQAIVITFQANH